MSENQKTMELAFGRIVRIMSRPEQEGDIQEYERCRKLFLDAAEESGLEYRTVQPIGIHRPGWNFGNHSLD